MFEHAAIVGVGLIGGSLALDLRAKGLAKRITGIGRTRANLETALERGIIDRETTSLAEGVADADLIFLATPVVTLERQIAELGECAPEGALVIDGGSVKQAILEAADKHLGDKVRFVPCHPIAGTEKGGAAAAFEGLYRNARCMITPGPSTAREAVAQARQLWEAVGSIVVEMDARDHDRLFGAVSHMPHVMAYALMAYLIDRSDGEEIIAFSGGGLRDYVRIAESPPEMWTDICRLNRAATQEAVEGLIDSLSRMRDAMQTGDWQELRELFEKAQAAKRAADKGSKA